jgi:histidinol phosphatase-like enzyme
MLDKQLDICYNTIRKRTERKIKRMKICFDMDGTIANLYGVEGWLDNLIAEDVRPYREAKTMLNMNSLARKLNKLQKEGHKIAVISWLSKCGSAEYDEAVTATKKAWLKKHLGSVKFDEINIVKYGTPKSLFCESAEDVLFDDEKPNRDNWAGCAYNVNNILEVLKDF